VILDVARWTLRSGNETRQTGIDAVKGVELLRGKIREKKYDVTDL
jgi:hypothetical protein